MKNKLKEMKEDVILLFKEAAPSPKKGRAPSAVGSVPSDEGRAPKPLGFKEIAYLLKLGRTEVNDLKRVLNEMLRDGELVMTRKGLYGHSSEMNLITGRFDAHRDGYGFVIPEKTGMGDLFIPPRKTLGALDGDRVIARLEEPARREGRIIRVLERAHTIIAGIIEVGRTACFVRPKKKSVNFDIYVAPKDKAGAKDGDAVMVEITEFPAERTKSSGRVVKVIKKPDDPASEVEAIVEEFNLPRGFPPNVISDAKSGYGKDAGGKRKDLRGLRTVTVDGERAKDFDDAVSIKLTEHGYTLYVHIADVGFYVGWDTPLDEEARSRATSVYFPDRVIPMLPPELSEDLCSLRPDVERPAFTAEMHFDRGGGMVDSKFYPSLIRSNERMTYTLVRKIIVDGDEKERQRYGYLLGDLELMAELTGLLRSKRRQRGSLDFDLPEPEVLLDLTGRPEAILRAERNFAHMMIEEFMIAANEAVAEFLSGLGVPCLYRVHEPPDSMKLDEIWKIIRPLLRADAKMAQVKGKKGSALRPDMFSKLLAAVKGAAEEEVVNYMILRSLKQAKYSPDNVGHFGLASKCYTHFTSPIRRYPDLVVHRILREVLTKNRLSDRRIEELQALLPDIASHSSHMERLSDEAEREVVDAMRVWFMKDKTGDEFKGRVVGVTPYGIKVRLEDFYIVGFLHVSYMTDDFYVFDEQSLTLTGRHTKRRFGIGQELTVRVDKVDMEEREIVFGVA
ncbi:MAG: ribonuclease R [Thermodesulfovibrionales bacterium]|nr:ribonuclease R [Thermodesulfovibrionales bacterium]